MPYIADIGRAIRPAAARARRPGEMTCFHEISENQYDEMLGMLPPAVMTGHGFLVGEALSQTEDGSLTFQAYIQADGRFYEADQPMTIREFRSLNLSDITLININRAAR